MFRDIKVIVFNFGHELKTMISGVYKISSLSNPDRYYIGSSQDIYKRWECHLRELKNRQT